jgi:hypothetical protein
VVRKSAPPLSPPRIKPPTEEQLEYLRPRIVDALGMGNNVPAAQRLDLLHGIEGALSEDECQALMNELLKPRPAGVAEEWFAEYMHEICLLLGREESIRTDFARILASLAGDMKRDEVIRDYSLQHLRLLWEKADRPLRASISSSFASMVTSGDPAIAPSALLSLHLLGSGMNMSVKPGEVPPAADGLSFSIPNSDIEPLVADMLSRPPDASNTVARMTAARVARERKITSLSPKLRQVAANTGGEHAVVRMAAIAALAKSGDATDLEFIKTLDRKDPRIESAILHALASRQ